MAIVRGHSLWLEKVVELRYSLTQGVDSLLNYLLRVCFCKTLVTLEF